MENINCCKSKEACTIVNQYYGCCKCEMETGGNGIGVPVLTEPITKTIEISELQDEIDALPKILMAYVTFIVNSGTYNYEILIEKFVGSGSLIIYGANTAGQASHNISNMIIQYCTNSRIMVQGFNALATADYVFNILYCLCASIHLLYCNSTAGNNNTTSLYGVRVTETNFALIQECTISNKRTAIRVARGWRVSTLDLYGTNNNMVYDSGRGGTIYKENMGTITGTTLNNMPFGGLIINPSGAILGS